MVAWLHEAATNAHHDKPHDSTMISYQNHTTIAVEIQKETLFTVYVVLIPFTCFCSLYAVPLTHTCV